MSTSTTPAYHWYPELNTATGLEKITPETQANNLKTLEDMKALCLDEDTEGHTSTIYLVSRELDNRVPGVHCLIVWPTYSKDDTSLPNGYHCFELMTDNDYNCFATDANKWYVRERWRSANAPSVKKWDWKRVRQMAILDGKNMKDFKELILKNYSRPFAHRTSVNCISYTWESLCRMTFLPDIPDFAASIPRNMMGSELKKRLNDPDPNDTNQSYWHAYIVKQMKEAQASTEKRYDAIYSSKNWVPQTEDDEAFANEHGGGVVEVKSAANCYKLFRSYVDANFTGNEGLPPLPMH